MTRDREAAGPRDRGMSLVELMMAMAIFGLLMAILGGVVVQMLKADHDTRSRLANVDQVRQGMDAMARTIRTAVRPAQLNRTCVSSCDQAFESIADAKVVFYANVGDTLAGAAVPTRFTYTVAPDPADVLGATAKVTEMRQKVAPGWTSGDYTFAGTCTPGGPTVAGCVARVVTSGIRWPFPTGEKPFVFRPSAEGAALPAGAGVGNVAVVDITLPLGTAADPAPSVSTTVFLPNSILGR